MSADRPEASEGSAGTARHFLDAAAWGATDGAVAALRHTLPRGLRPAATTRGQRGARFRASAPDASAPRAQSTASSERSASLVDVALASLFIFGGGSEPQDPGASGQDLEDYERDEFDGCDPQETSRGASQCHLTALPDSRETGSPPPSDHSGGDAENAGPPALMVGDGASAPSSPRSSDNESISDAFPQAARRGSAMEALRQSPQIEVARRGSLGSASAERGGGHDASSAGRGAHGDGALSRQASRRSSGGPLTVDRSIAEQLEAARRLAAERRFPEAVRECLRVLVGPDRAIALLHDICSSLEASASEDALALKEALSEAEASQGVWRLLEERQAALEEEARGREGAERRASEHLGLVRQLRMEQRALKDLLQAKEAQIAAELRRREEAVREAADLRLRCALHESALRENALLRQRLQEAAAPAPSFEGIARRVAELECGPLRQCSQQGRQALKRKILIKWHPDKQPSADHAALATQVMQELQNLPEWAQEGRSASLGR